VLPGKTYTVNEVLQALWKRKWLVVVPFVLGTAAAVFAAKRVTPLYRSETLIMVVPQRIPDSYVKSTVTATVQDRLPSISEQILSRSRLERIITDLDLYQQQRATGVMEDVVQRMRRDIDVKLEGKESFRVAYISSNPQLAQKVTERLASLYIDENLRDRENLAESTNQFLESQLADAKRRLVEHEKKLEDYRKRYSGQLPTQMQSNLQAISNAQLQLQSLSEGLNRSQERRLLLERQLADAQAAPVPTVPEPGAANGQEVPLTAAQQLAQAQTRLEAFRLRYTEDHPDVRALERVIRDLKVKADEEAKNPPSPAARVLTPAEAARQKRIKDLQAELAVLDHQIATSQQEAAQLKGTIASYQAKVDAAPTRESELVELTRDYGTLQASYTSLLQKREESKISANLERNQIGEQFKILDPASLPEKAYNSKQRLMVAGGGTAGALLFGLACIALLEFLDSSFKREDEVLRVLELPVLATVPLIAADTSGGKPHKRRRLAGAVGAIVAVGLSAAFMYWRLHL
jgi:polysaccharide chain length determinant protein (PEP-CTERM system associated)